MGRIFASYGTLMLLVFALAMQQGYALDSLFSGSHRSGGAGNHYHK